MEMGAVVQKEGLYLYGIAAGERPIDFGPAGVDDSTVYSVPSGGFSAIVHRCAAEPYQSPDRDTVARWVQAHQRVVERARENFGTVIPAGFDTILNPQDRGGSADQALTDWLGDNSGRLAGILRKIRGKDEFGVQVSCAQRSITGEIPGEVRRLENLVAEISEKQPGTAFLYRQRFQREMKAAAETVTARRSRELYARIEPHCDDIVPEKTRKTDEDRVMLLNLSCLVAKERAGSLAAELDKISQANGLLVRFTGPWPPYSFVTMPELPVGKDASP
ncbi:MAG: GvpL/GvpF family gas vesicle protein [Chloroflexi bacterium]|nr:GvpL/GvpF family gas vesicle protein [Chloroflexota bacterium]